MNKPIRPCKKCGETNRRKFHKKPRSKCRDCYNQYQQQYYQTCKKHMGKRSPHYARKYKTMHLYLRRLLTKARNRRKRECTITLPQLISIYNQQDGRCALTGLLLTHEANKETNASIDRINSNYGYTVENVQLVCARVNFMKGNLSDCHFVMWCKKVAENS